MLNIVFTYSTTTLLHIHNTAAYTVVLNTHIAFTISNITCNAHLCSMFPAFNIATHTIKTKKIANQPINIIFKSVLPFILKQKYKVSFTCITDVTYITISIGAFI